MDYHKRCLFSRVITEFYTALGRKLFSNKRYLEILSRITVKNFAIRLSQKIFYSRTKRIIVKNVAIGLSQKIFSNKRIIVKNFVIGLSKKILESNQQILYNVESTIKDTSMLENNCQKFCHWIIAKYLLSRISKNLPL